MRNMPCVITVVFIVAIIAVALTFFLLFVFAVTAQSEPGSPVTAPIAGTDISTPVTPIIHATHGPPDDGSMPGVLNGTLPATVTPWATPRVTPTLNLPVGEPPPGCTDCGGQQPGIVFTLRELFSRVKSIFRK